MSAFGNAVSRSWMYTREHLAGGAHGMGHGHHPHRVAVSVTVEDRDILRVRKAVVQCTGPAVDLIECAPVAHSTLARMRILCDRERAPEIMHAIMQTVDTAEFGRFAV